MKKIERQRQFVQDHLSLFRCPNCQAPMAKVEGNSIYCAHGHQIDFNRHGYLHFLNGAADTEYGRQMGCDGFMLYSYDYLDNEQTKKEMENLLTIWGQTS